MDSPARQGLPADIRNTILRFDTCKVANAIESMGIRLRNEGFTRAGLRCVTGSRERVLGHAVTARVKCADPPLKGSHPAYDLGAWWQTIADSPRPSIAVIEDADPEPGVGAVLSDIHAHVLASLACGGVVTNGAVRNVEALSAMSFPAFAGSVGLSHSYVHLVAHSTPVTVFGLRVEPGDLIYADVHGAIQIPWEAAGPLAGLLDERAERERELIGLCERKAPLEEIRQKARTL